MHRHLTTVCALGILILCTLTLTFSTHAKRTFYTTQSPSPIKVALSSSGAVASAFSVHSSPNYSAAVWQGAAAADDVVWVEDAIPAGATAAGEGWNWISSNPSPFSGTLAHTTNIIAGLHQHYFFNATQTLAVNAGDTLVAHVYLDPANPPTEVMLQFNDGTWEHRAYWGQNQWEAGTDGTVSRRNMGALPPTGQWVRLEVPASSVGLEGRTLNGMAFSLVNGRATWDRAGKSSGTPVITISDVSLNEGNSGTTSAVFTVTLSSASMQTVSVNYATANSTASSPSDYAAASGTLTFDPGQTSKQITIPVVGDTTAEFYESFFVNLSAAVNAALADNQGIGAIFNDDVQPSISEVVWVEDAVPAGATAADHFEGWNWTSFNPSPFSGTLAHTSNLVAGVHQHYFFNTTQTLTVNAGDILIAHVYLDPENPPTQVMLQFNDGTWEHRAYWGQNHWGAGIDGTVSCRNMGALPPTGQWVRLEVPASSVGLEGRTLNGMAFSLFNGRATWDRAGKYAVPPVTPTISISDATAIEGNPAMFTVTLSNASTQSISVNYATANGTATSPDDYLAASGMLTFAPGQTSKALPITTVDDTIDEPDENFFVNLSNPVNATLGDSQGVGTIVDNDPPPTISISDVTVNEGNSGTTQAMFTVTLSGASTQTISVNYATANGTASSPSDYIAKSGTVTFAPNQTSPQSITITVAGDTVSEANENFFVNLSSPANATIADNQGIGTILNLSYFEIPVYFHVIRDTDGTGDIAESRLDAQISVLNSAFNGTNVGNIQFFFWKAGVTRNTNRDWFQMDFLNAQQESGAEHEAKRTLRQGGANALNFYTARGGTSTPFRFAWATFAEEYANNSCRDGIVVPFTTLPEDVTPNNPFNAGDLPVHEVGHWLGLLHTFEGTTSTSCNNADDKVDDTPAHKNQFIGECPPPSTDTCDTLPGTDPIHNYMTDYSDACKSEFTRGQFERMRDQYITFRQSTTPPSCPVVTMSISDGSVTEGNSGGAFVNFTVTLSGPSTQQIRANFKTVDGTATGGVDYFALSSGSATVDFAPGQTSQTFSVQVIGDTTVEANETFFINLFNPRNCKIGDGEGIGTIVNDDSIPAILINDVTVIEGNSAVFNVTLSSASTQTISVNYATANGTATSPSDYLARSGSVSFAPGQTNLALTIQTEDDTIDEPDETFFVNLSTPVNATISDSQGVGTILDNDPPPTISITDVTVNEGNSGTSSAVFNVTLSSVSGKTISVNYTTANGTATSPSDYLALSGTVTFAPNQTSQPITIQVVGDTIVEPNENFFVNLSNPVNVTLADGQGVVTILNDDASPVYEGWVDVADCNAIIGWAADRNRPNTSITVSIYDGNNPVIIIPASDLRNDVGAYLGDNGRHGFAITTPWQFKDGMTHTLRVKFESGTTELSTSPRTITCATYYEIVARHSGKCLDVEGESLNAGARLIQFGCGGWANQQFRVIHVGGGFFKIVARHSGKVLDVQGGGLDNGTPVWQWDDNGTAAQQWQIIDVGGGYFKIVARHSGKVLDVAGVSFTDGAQIHQWDYVGAGNQQWQLRPVP